MNLSTHAVALIVHPVDPIWTSKPTSSFHVHNGFSSTSKVPNVSSNSTQNTHLLLCLGGVGVSQKSHTWWLLYFNFLVHIPLQGYAILPLLPIFFPIVWICLNLYGTARIQVLFTFLKEKEKVRTIFQDLHVAPKFMMIHCFKIWHLSSVLNCVVID